VRRFLGSLFSGRNSSASNIQRINSRRAEMAKLSDDDLKAAGRRSNDLLEFAAIVAVIASRVLGLEMFDVQLQGALFLADGRIAEMQTGEGKTLAAVPAIAWYAKGGQGVHVMTVNDYLARRDVKWMGGIYEFLGLSAGCIQQGMSVEERKRAYACDITYATANEIGFDYLRDQLALFPESQVHRPFAAAVIDEADSILIDEARIPLVIAGGKPDVESLAHRVDRMVRHFHRFSHFTVDEYGRNIALTDAGIQAVEDAFACGNLYAEENFGLLTAVQDSLHAHALLRRDVDYLVKDGAVESVDEFKGRIAQDRRWPAGLHSAIEAKEGVALKTQGKVLGSITLQNLIALYPKVCGMIRVDHPDVKFRTKREKESAVVNEIRDVHQTGRPILVGTASVEESERLSTALGGIRHEVLNARNEEEEAAIIARAGEPGAVTISTNMAGRGVDIRLGEGVAGLGGLYVIGTNRHESRRIDNQLRGRAGRQGDPGTSRFFVSLEDDLLLRHAADSPHAQDPESLQRVVEGQNLGIRRFLHKYESVVEGQRQAIQSRRQAILNGATPCSSELERLVSLTTIDDLWSEHLAAITDFREGIQWVSWGGRDPLHEYLTTVHTLFEELQAGITDEIQKRLEEAETSGLDPTQRGSTWTYLTTDQPFGSWSERIMRGVLRKLRSRSMWG
jgi:preprotein translocase subunit SecA